jgi:CheY-like chemotaxis protein
LELARQLRPDLVVTDWMMPRMNGVVLCGELARGAEFQGLPVIMHSASGNPRAPGVQRFVAKTGLLEHFEEAVTHTLEQARRSQPEVPPGTGPRAPPAPASASRRGPGSHRERRSVQSAARTAASAAS